MRYVLIFLLLTASVAHADAIDPSQTPGTILINVRDYYRYAEFRFKDGVIQGTGSGEVEYYERDGVTHIASSSDRFFRIFNERRLYRYKIKDRLMDILSRLDMKKAHDLLLDYSFHGGKLKQATYSLNVTVPQEESILEKYGDHYYPNRQLTYAVFYDYSHTGALVDLTDGEMSFPFGASNVKGVVWSDDGDKVAFMSIDKRDRSALVIHDITGERDPLSIPLRKVPYDITWSPDASYVAVLTSTRFLGLWPWELLAAAAGHPYFHITFYMEIYDTAGNRVFKRRIRGGLKNGSGKIVWIQ